MGDEHRREFPVYLPPGYDSSKKARYPVAFVLSGWGGRGSSYISDDSPFGISLPKRLDKAIAESRLRPLIVVFPDCSSKLGGSQFINSPSLGNYSDHLCDELVELVDSKFRTEPSADFRGLLGHSSGGFGALINGMHRPDRFKFICSSAGDSFFEVSLLPFVNNALAEIEKSGSLVRFIDEILNQPDSRLPNRAKGDALMLLSMAPCYSPNPSKGPLFGDPFFDFRTGAIIDEIWQKYLAWDPIRRCESQKANLKKLKYIHLCSGLQDEYGLQFGHRQISEKFKQYKIRHEFEEYPGGHSGHTWRYESRLIKMTSAMYE